MRIYVARHGETEWNVLWKVCGRTDIPLTENGQRQAQLLAQDAVGRGIDMIISSPMIRAQQTARAVAEKLGLQVVTDPRLIEQDYGIYEGAYRKDPGFLHCKRNFATRYPGGESMLDLAQRVYDLLDELNQIHPERTVLLVCHGGVMRSIRSYFEDMTNEEYFGYTPPNAVLTSYEYR